MTTQPSTALAHRAHALRTALASVALVAGLAFAGVAGAQLPLSVLSHGFIVQVPQGWEVNDETDGDEALYFLTNPNHAGGVIIAAGPLDGPEGAAYQAEGLPGLAELSFGLVAGVPGVQRSALVRESVHGIDAAGFAYQGSELGGRFVYFVANGSIYALGSIADAEAGAAMDAALEQVLASFQWVAMSPPDAPDGASDPFVGTFSGDGLSLSLSRSGGAYVGSLTFSGQTYAAQASESGVGALAGTFVSGGAGFAFDLVVEGDTRVFTTGGSRYVLRR